MNIKSTKPMFKCGIKLLNILIRGRWYEPKSWHLLQMRSLSVRQYAQSYHFVGRVINEIYNTPSPNKYCT